MIELLKYVFNAFSSINEGVGNYIFNFYTSYSRIILDYMHISFETLFKIFLYTTIILASFYLFMSFFVLFSKRQKSKIATGNLPYVTVQIPTYNELAALNCAKRCLNFDYPKNKLQIIIGDDSNDIEISKKIDLFASKYKNIQITRRGCNVGFKPGNLNYMLKYTKGEYIVIFDSDFLPGKFFLKKIIAPFLEDKNVAVVQTRWRIFNFNQNIISILGGSISTMFHHIAMEFIKRINGNCFLCGSGEAIKKKDLVDVGGWQAGSLTEDIECSFRLITKGKKLVYLEDVEVDCEVPYTFKDLCKQQMRWAFGVITALIKHGKTIFNSKSCKLKDKISVFIFASGYFFSFLLLGLTFFGVLSLISDRPAAIDWPKFISETSFNIVLTSGFLLTSIIALVRVKKKRFLPKMITASLSLGLAVTYYVNIGILKAIFGRQMQWFMLNKNGNKCLEE